MNKNRDSRLDLIRTVAIISVISVHFLFYCGCKLSNNLQ